eukprot:GHVO01025847.1.p1 GENE.GHVO01025847.1~~GHVO01025847.1.p1  ORF type:complete len:169 (+),score=15.14 GHVO01025847.1:284-790(+)
MSNSKKRSKGGAAADAKKKKTSTVGAILLSEVDKDESTTSSPIPFVESEAPSPVKQYVFKNPTFVHSAKGSGKRGPGHRTWKTLKQIIASERGFPRKPDDASYESLDAPPSFNPAKKYSDLSGLPSHYTDPQTKLRYSNADEFSRIKMLPSDIVSGYLALRKANAPVP